MKSWFVKLRLSFARDAAKPLAATLRKQLETSEELRRFAEASETLERRLRNPVGRPEPPASLHDSIMRAVQAVEPREALIPERTRRIPRWLPAPAFALLVLLLLGVWWSTSETSTPMAQPNLFASAASALDAAPQVTRDIPAQALSPLTEEWEHLDRDLNKTADFLITSIP